MDSETKAFRSEESSGKQRSVNRSSDIRGKEVQNLFCAGSRASNSQIAAQNDHGYGNVFDDDVAQIVVGHGELEFCTSSLQHDQLFMFPVRESTDAFPHGTESRCMIHYPSAYTTFQRLPSTTWFTYRMYRITTYRMYRIASYTLPQMSPQVKG